MCAGDIRAFHTLVRQGARPFTMELLSALIDTEEDFGRGKEGLGILPLGFPMFPVTSALLIRWYGKGRGLSLWNCRFMIKKEKFSTAGFCWIGLAKNLPDF
jgi:hypothetical protein